MIQIVSFKPEYAVTFKALNEAWINEHFEMEESDRLMLNDPEGYIISKGGEILIALLDQKPVGTCALIKHDDDRFELAKMAVTPKAQGKKVGFAIGKAIVEKAKEVGCGTLFLETNSKLTPAINLYHKLGFTEKEGEESPYNRCNVYMELQP